MKLASIETMSALYNLTEEEAIRLMLSQTAIETTGNEVAHMGIKEGRRYLMVTDGVVPGLEVETGKPISD